MRKLSTLFVVFAAALGCSSPEALPPSESCEDGSCEEEFDVFRDRDACIEYYTDDDEALLNCVTTANDQLAIALDERLQELGVTNNGGWVQDVLADYRELNHAYGTFDPVPVLLEIWQTSLGLDIPSFVELYAHDALTTPEGVDMVSGEWLRGPEECLDSYWSVLDTANDTEHQALIEALTACTLRITQEQYPAIAATIVGGEDILELVESALHIVESEHLQAAKSLCELATFERESPLDTAACRHNATVGWVDMILMVADNARKLHEEPSAP